MCALRNMSAGLVDIFKGRVWRTLKVGVGTDHMYGASHLLPRGEGEWRRWAALQDCSFNVQFEFC